VRREFVQQWLDKAEAGFGVAEQLVAAFRCQQAAEKFLKAFLVEHEIEFPKTHNIADLLGLVAMVNYEASRILPYNSWRLAKIDGKDLPIHKGPKEKKTKVVAW